MRSRRMSWPLEAKGVDRAAAGVSIRLDRRRAMLSSRRGPTGESAAEA
jgi:hypothetical protein